MPICTQGMQRTWWTIYCAKMIERMELIFDTHTTEYTWKSFYIFNAMIRLRMMIIAIYIYYLYINIIINHLLPKHCLVTPAVPSIIYYKRCTILLLLKTLQFCLLCQWQNLARVQAVNIHIKWCIETKRFQQSLLTHRGGMYGSVDLTFNASE